MRGRDGSEHGCGWGPFSGRQLTTIVCVGIVVLVVIPTAALAATGVFSSTTMQPAVKAVNSSGAVGAVGVVGRAGATGNAVRVGVDGSATGASGVGVKGTGSMYGVFSNGPLGVAVGKKLRCTACVTAGAFAPGALPHPDLARIATLNWYGGTYAGGSYGFNGPQGVAFDGTHIWVANFSGASVTELNASDGKWVRTLSGGSYGFNGPYALAFDGTHVWVPNFSGNSVTELNAR